MHMIHNDVLMEFLAERQKMSASGAKVSAQPPNSNSAKNAVCGARPNSVTRIFQKIARQKVWYQQRNRPH